MKENYIQEQNAYIEGRKAFSSKQSITVNPYDFLKDTKCFKRWIHGWNDAYEIDRLIREEDARRCYLNF